MNLLAADCALSVTEAEHIGGAMGYHFPGHKIALLRRTPTSTPMFDALGGSRYLKDRRADIHGTECRRSLASKVKLIEH